MKRMKRSCDIIDLMKFIGSILILTMHLNPFTDHRFFRLLSELLARWGVPFFFITSAYFLFSKTESAGVPQKAINKYTGRIAVLYLVWMLYNIPSIIYKRLWGTDLTDPAVWLTFAKNSMLSSTFTGSWYLLSCVFSAWFVFLLCRKHSTAKAIRISSLFYLLCILSSAYYGILPKTVSSVLMFLCFPLNLFNGCIYFALGKYVSENERFLTERFSAFKCAFFAFVFYLLYICEIYIAKATSILGSTDAAFCLVPLSFFILLFCLQRKTRIKGHFTMRKISTIIYCCQGNVLIINNRMGKWFGIEQPIKQYLISILIVIMICFAVLFIQKNKHCRWANYLT